MKLDDQNLPKILLILAILTSIYIRLPVFDHFIMPTFGNTFIHVTIARETIDTGYFPLIDYSYGGGIPNLYVPAYRMLIAELSLLFGVDIIILSRYLVLFFGVLASLSFYVLTKSFSNEWAGVFAAFLASISPELVIYTLRPLPQSLGMVLVPFAIFAIVKNNYLLTALSFIFISLLHQETALVLVGIIFVYYNLALLFKSSAERLALIAFIIGVFTYLIWHFAIVGNINIMELAQFKYKESGSSPNLFDLTNGVEKMPLFTRIGFLVSLFTIPGLLISLKKKNYLLLSFFILNFLAVGNEYIGIGVFADRFVAYLCQPMVVLSAIAIYSFLSYKPKIERIIKLNK